MALPSVEVLAAQSEKLRPSVVSRIDQAVADYRRRLIAAALGYGRQPDDERFFGWVTAESSFADGVLNDFSTVSLPRTRQRT
jgi:hypothetical protein